MSLEFDAKDYTKSHSPKKNLLDFFRGKLTELGWTKSERNEIIMDIGCGPGGTTKEVILPFFPKIEKIVAMDVMPSMIDIAREKNADPKIEYIVADIAEWSTVEQWEGKMSKIFSLHCFHWVKDQKQGIQNIYRLLMSGGEAALFFVVEGSLFDVVESLQNSSKWNKYLKDCDNRIPKSHFCKYDASYYKNLAETIGFEVIHCSKEEKNDVMSTDEGLKTFLSSLCVLTHYIPTEHKEDFKNDLLQEVVERNGRTDTGLPFHKAQLLQLVVRKK